MHGKLLGRTCAACHSSASQAIPAQLATTPATRPSPTHPPMPITTPPLLSTQKQRSITEQEPRKRMRCASSIEEGLCGIASPGFANGGFPNRSGGCVDSDDCVCGSLYSSLLHTYTFSSHTITAPTSAKNPEEGLEVARKLRRFFNEGEDEPRWLAQHAVYTNQFI